MTPHLKILKKISFITWKDVLSTGIKEIDEQHKDIVELIN